jgi:WD40 repeat protein
MKSRRCLFTMGSHTASVTAVKWGGDGLLYSAARDCSINVWSAEDGRLVRALKGHGHWVNTMSLSAEYALRTGAFDHTGKAPADVQEAKKVGFVAFCLFLLLLFIIIFLFFFCVGGWAKTNSLIILYFFFSFCRLPRMILCLECLEFTRKRKKE